MKSNELPIGRYRTLLTPESDQNKYLLAANSEKLVANKKACWKDFSFGPICGEKTPYSPHILRRKICFGEE